MNHVSISICNLSLLLSLCRLTSSRRSFLSLRGCLKDKGFVFRNSKSHDHKFVPLDWTVSGQVHTNLLDHLSLTLQQFPFRLVNLLGVFWHFARILLSRCLSDSTKKDLSLNSAVEVKEGVASLVAELLKVGLKFLESVVARLWILILWLVEERREESLADLGRNNCVVASVQAALEDKQVRNSEEDLSITALNLFLELRILLSSALDERAKADELLAHRFWYQVRATQAPSFLEPCDKMNEFWVVPQLWINHLDIL